MLLVLVEPAVARADQETDHQAKGPTTRRDGASVANDAVTSNDQRQQAIGITQLIVYVPTAIAFIAWLFRVYGNLEPLGARKLRYGRGWAIGGWFLPIGNLFIPKQIVNDAWRGSDPERSGSTWEWERTPVPEVLTVWWVMFLTTWILDRVARGLTRREVTVEDSIEVAQVFVASDLLLAIEGGLLIVMVRMITRRQQAAADALGTRDEVGEREETSGTAQKENLRLSTAARVLIWVTLGIALLLVRGLPTSAEDVGGWFVSLAVAVGLGLGVWLLVARAGDRRDDVASPAILSIVLLVSLGGVVIDSVKGAPGEQPTAATSDPLSEADLAERYPPVPGYNYRKMSGREKREFIGSDNEAPFAVAQDARFLADRRGSVLVHLIAIEPEISHRAGFESEFAETLLLGSDEPVEEITIAGETAYRALFENVEVMCLTDESDGLTVMLYSETSDLDPVAEAFAETF